jgi:hypothetical protein
MPSKSDLQSNHSQSLLSGIQAGRKRFMTKYYILLIQGIEDGPRWRVDFFHWTLTDDEGYISESVIAHAI